MELTIEQKDIIKGYLNVAKTIQLNCFNENPRDSLMLADEPKLNILEEVFGEVIVNARNFVFEECKEQAITTRVRNRIEREYNEFIENLYSDVLSSGTLELVNILIEKKLI